MTARTYAPFAATLVLSTGLLLAQGTVSSAPPAAQDQKTVPEVTMTGCLIQGSGPTVFLLDNARLPTEDPKTLGKSYVLGTKTADVDFTKHLNHEVTITGTIDMKVAPVPPAGQKVPEKDLSRFWATNVTMIADKCAGVLR